MLQVLGGVLVVERPGERRIGEDQRVFFLLACVVLRQPVAVADVGIFHAVQQHVHAADAQHGVVEVETVEKLVMEVARQFGVAKDLRMALAQIFARRHKKRAVPQAGSQRISVGFGATITTISRMI